MLNFWANQDRQVGLLTLADEVHDHYPLDTRISRLSLDLIASSDGFWQGLSANVVRMRRIRACVVEFSPDVVISFIERTNILVLAALLGTRFPVIVSERIDPRQYGLDGVRRVARRCLYPLARSLVMQTQSVAEWGRAIMMTDKVVVIANPINALPAPGAFSKRTHSVVAVGRLTHQKGLDLLIQAFAASRMRKNGWVLNILGEGPDRGMLQNLIDELDVADQVSLIGVVSEPWQWLDQARVFVLPSRFEGFPNALLEAMSMGCACIAADCPSGPGEIINNRVNGILVPTEDVEGLVLAMDGLEQNQQLAEALAERAKLVRDRFAIEKIMSEWDALISSKVAP